MLRPSVCVVFLLLSTIINQAAPINHAKASQSGARYGDKPLIKYPQCEEGKIRYRSPLLSLDGGGLRGIITTEVLIEVENSLKKSILARKDEVYHEVKHLTSPNEFEIDLGDFFESIAGVDSGSWIATYLTSRGGNGASAKVFNDKFVIKKYGIIRPGSVEGLRVFFLYYAKRLYPTFTLGVSVLPRRYGVEVKAAGWNCPTYPIRGLEATLDMFLGESRMMDTHGTTLLVHVYDLLQKSAVLFLSDHFKGESGVRTPEQYTYTLRTTTARGDFTQKDKCSATSVSTVVGKDFFMKDVARASSASPTIFEAKRFTAINDESFELYAIDGSMMANNPTILAAYFVQGSTRLTSSRSLTVLSIGCGISTGRYRRHSDSGALEWFIFSNDFLSIVMDGGSEFVQANFFILFNNNVSKGKRFNPDGPPGYLRIQVVYDQRTAQGAALGEMYDANNVENLQEVGFQTVARFKNLIADHVRAFVTAPCVLSKKGMNPTTEDWNQNSDSTTMESNAEDLLKTPTTMQSMKDTVAGEPGASSLSTTAL